MGILIFYHSYHCPDATYHMGRWAFWGDGWYFIPWRRLMYIRMYRRNLYTIPPLGRTLCTNRRGWMRYNWLLYQRMYNPMGTNCSQCPYNSPQQRRIQTGMKWTGRRQMHSLAQLSNIIQLFFSSSPPLVRQRTKQHTPKGRIEVEVGRTVVRAIPLAINGRRGRGVHPARHGGTYHTTPAIFIIVRCC